MTKIDIVSGFLGAGKTTLIKKMVKEAYQGEKLVLIENEFGEISIDGGFLKDAGIQISEMSSGCICCSLVGDFGKALREVKEQFQPDRILIEPSGVGKLSDVIVAVENTVADIPDMKLNSFVTVADAGKVKVYMKNFGEFYNNQIEAAGTIILSRTQKLTQEKLEAAVALADMWGVKVSVVEMMDQILPGVLSHSLAKMAAHDCESHKVNVYTSEKVLKLEGKDGAVSKVVTDKRELPAQLVIFAAGFVPNGQLAKDAGLEVASFGAVVVDEHMRTSDPAIYAGGDCVCIKNIITGKPGYLPLGSMANRQGRVIGTNLAGGDATFPGYAGAWAVKLFELSFCGAGLTVERARKEGYDAIGVSVEQLDRAHFYPEKNMMSLELVVDKPTRRVLGIQGACSAGDALKARVDAVASVLQYAKPTVEDISNLEISYAPPFASAMDVVNVVANVADNVLAGRFKPVTGDEFMELWKKRNQNHIFFIDARPAKAGQAVQAEHPEWHSIPLEEIAARVNEVPRDRPVALICNTGLRAYDSLLVLARNGITDVVNSTGGMQAVAKMGLKP